jgi:hypothetical protein
MPTPTHVPLALIISAIALLTTGCVSTLSLTDGHERRLAAQDCVNVRLDPKDENHVDKGDNHFDVIHAYDLSTGHIWKRAFYGDETASATLSVDNAWAHSRPGVYVSQFTYEAAATLTVGGERHQLRARASRRAAVQYGSAWRQSVELCIGDIARQAVAILASRRADIAIEPAAAPLP